ncbi:MAG: MoaD/ThiS family protein [Arenicellales bacterium]|jgi:thiamine biosynthesis protein ThiS
MQIELKLFSSLMEYLPANAEGNTLELNLSGTTSCHALIDRYKIPRDIVQVVMVNGEFVPPEQRETPLTSGDTVSIWPAIQGG